MRKGVLFHRPRVALLIESSRAYGRATLSGVARYIRQHAQWSIFLQEQSLCDDLPGWFANWKGDGVITRMEDSALASTNLGLPVSQWPVVATNIFDADGNFSVTSGSGPNTSRQFYLLKLQQD